MKTLFLLHVLFSALYINARNKKISLESAVKCHVVKFKIKGTGKHMGNCLDLHLENLRDDSLIILLESGRRLDSQNNNEQDIFVTQDQFFVLGAHQIKNYTINGFCCQASNHSPAKSSSFNIGKMADQNLKSIASFLNNRKFDETTLQSAVWCVSDKRSIASIPKVQNELREVLSAITGEELPWYELEYDNSSSDISRTQTAQKVFGYIDYKLKKTSKVKIELRDEKERLIMNIVNNKMVSEGEHDFWFEMQTINYPKGKYYVNFITEDGIIAKKTFMI